MKVNIYSKGIVHCSVCAPKDLQIKDIEDEVNLSNPTGIQNSWKVDKENFKRTNYPFTLSEEGRRIT